MGRRDEGRSGERGVDRRHGADDRRPGPRAAGTPLDRRARPRETGSGALAAAVGTTAGAVGAGVLGMPAALAHATLLGRWLGEPVADPQLEAMVAAWSLVGTVLGGLVGCLLALRDAGHPHAGRTMALLSLVFPLTLAALVGALEAFGARPTPAALLLAPAIALALVAALVREVEVRAGDRGPLRR